MVGVTLFIGGFVGLTLYTVFLVWEQSRGERVFATFRARCDEAASNTYRTLVFGELPRTYRSHMVLQGRKLIHDGIHSLAALLRAVERPLSRTSRRMQHAHEAENGEARTPSPFLKDIADERKKNGKNPQDSV